MTGADVILVGASVRSLAESAVRDGLQPICIDQFGDSDLRRLLTNSGLSEAHHLRIIDNFALLPEVLTEFDVRIPVIISGGIENDTRLVDQLFADRIVAASSTEALSRIRDPDTVFQILHDAGCHVPDWFRVASETSRAGLSPSRWLAKDFKGSGGQSIQWMTQPDQPSVVTMMPSQSKFVQRYIEGIPVSATFLCNRSPAPSVESERPSQGEIAVDLLGTALQLSGCKELNATGFQFCGNVGPIAMSASLRKQICKAGSEVASNWPITGVFGIDFVVKDNVAWILEVNPRITASHELHELSAPARNGHVVLQLSALGHRNRPVSHVRQTSVSAGTIARLVVYADRDLGVDADCEQRMLSATRDHHSGVWLADVPCAGSVVPAYRPLCSIYLQLVPRVSQIELARKLGDVPANLAHLNEEFLSGIQAQTEKLQMESNFGN